MKLIAVLMTIGLVSCGFENDKSDNNQEEAKKTKEVKQVTNEASVPSSEAKNLHNTLIARIEVNAAGETIGQPETRGFNGSTAQFENGDATVANAFEGSTAVASTTVDNDSSSSQCYNCNYNGWYSYNSYNNYYPSSYYRYYYAASYSSSYYVNYSYSNFYSYNNYRYYCYSPYYY